VTWINVEGLHEVEVIGKLGDAFGLHPLILEDILSTDQRPKIEDLDEYVYIVKILSYNGQSHEAVAEQASLILGSAFVIFFQERAGEVFEPIRERIKKSRGRVRQMGADYLAYAMLDIYLSSVSNRMNEVMKTLAVITTLFMPISFLAGFFGMNFFQPVAPLSAWTDRPAFVLMIVAMVMVPVGMYLWMRRRAWM
jgi:Mg2+ and Co2+ transporter CorA